MEKGQRCERWSGKGNPIRRLKEEMKKINGSAVENEYCMK